MAFAKSLKIGKSIVKYYALGILLQNGSNVCDHILYFQKREPFLFREKIG